MGLWLKQSTTPTVKIGPFLDETTGKDAENGLTLTQADIRLSMNGGNFAQKTEANNATIDELGYYDCPLDATDTGTLGRLQLAVHEAGALPVYHEYMVVTANVYDTLCSTDLLQSDLTQIGGVAQSATDLKDFADEGYNPATNKVTGVLLCDQTTLVDTVATVTDLIVRQGTAQAGAPRTITLDAGASAINNMYIDDVIWILSGTGAKQARTIKKYVGATKIATVRTAWTTNPANDSVFRILPRGKIEAEVTPISPLVTTIATLASQTSFTLTEGSPDNDAYNDFHMIVTDATTEHQKCIAHIENYIGATKTVTLEYDPGVFTMAVGDRVEILAVMIHGDYIADSVLDEVVEGTLTVRQSLRLIASLLASKSSGGGTNTLVYRDYDDTKPRLTFTVDANGNRSAVARDAT